MEEDIMSDSLRPTGIPFIEALPWGSHICAFYSSSQDLVDLSVRYFTAGLLNNEFCLWITPEELRAREAAASIRKALPDNDRKLLEHQLEIVSQKDWLFNHGRLDTVRARKGFVKKLSQSLAQNYEGLRACGSPPWARSERKNLSEFEKKLDKLVARKRILLICAFQTRQYQLDEFMEIVRHHGSVLVKSKGNWQHILLSRREVILPSSEEYGTLTARERQVLRLVSEGLTNVEIASLLTISPRTVEAHRARLMRKLRLRNQVDLMRFALSSPVNPID
jgi:DNA-binding CsgD family transcriptional regulator